VLLLLLFLFVFFILCLLNYFYPSWHTGLDFQCLLFSPFDTFAFRYLKNVFSLCPGLNDSGWFFSSPHFLSLSRVSDPCAVNRPLFFCTVPNHHLLLILFCQFTIHPGSMNLSWVFFCWFPCSIRLQNYVHHCVANVTTTTTTTSPLAPGIPVLLNLKVSGVLSLSPLLCICVRCFEGTLVETM